VSEEVNRKCCPRWYNFQPLHRTIDPERHNAECHRQTDRR